MPAQKNASPLLARYEKLKTGLSEVGLILVGSITRRIDKRPDPKQPGRLKPYGPYYQWTFKEKGKTKTVNLTASQARQFRKAIDNHRKLQRTLLEMRKLSLQILQATTESVPQRKSRGDETRAKR